MQEDQKSKENLKFKLNPRIHCCFATNSNNFDQPQANHEKRDNKKDMADSDLENLDEENLPIDVDMIQIQICDDFQ